MSASRASLSMLDSSRLPSESGDLADRSDSRMQMFKSYDSLDVSTSVSLNISGYKAFTLSYASGCTASKNERCGNSTCDEIMFSFFVFFFLLIIFLSSPIFTAKPFSPTHDLEISFLLKLYTILGLGNLYCLFSELFSGTPISVYKEAYSAVSSIVFFMHFQIFSTLWLHTWVFTAWVMIFFMDSHHYTS